MKKVTRISILTLGFCLFFIGAYAQDKPNIIFILADDLGYGDLGCYGAVDIRTPNIDKLAKNGIKFTRAYANSTVCSPSSRTARPCCGYRALRPGK